MVKKSFNTYNIVFKGLSIFFGINTYLNIDNALDTLLWLCMDIKKKTSVRMSFSYYILYYIILYYIINALGFRALLHIDVVGFLVC